jgi:hypothetical protein
MVGCFVIASAGIRITDARLRLHLTLDEFSGPTPRLTASTFASPSAVSAFSAAISNNIG